MRILCIVHTQYARIKENWKFGKSKAMLTIDQHNSNEQIANHEREKERKRREEKRQERERTRER
jgi:hypothetical protein